MDFEADLAWTVLLLLGGLHGINPAMGWLFAVSLGLQEGNSRAVWRSLGPLALGHALAIAAALLAAMALGQMIPLAWMKWIVAVALAGSGALHLRRHRHPRWGGMRVGARELTLWSFLVASAHGAGLMAVPFVPIAATAHAETPGHMHAHTGVPATEHARHAAMAGFTGVEMTGLMAVALHTLGYLVVTGLLALLVHEKLGLRMLRTAWINLGLIWAGALIVTGVLTLSI